MSSAAPTAPAEDPRADVTNRTGLRIDGKQRSSMISRIGPRSGSPICEAPPPRITTCGLSRWRMLTSPMPRARPASRRMPLASASPSAAAAATNRASTRSGS
ncbi:hypothetical protein P4H44_00555, partial [Paenibacillus alginolyticus]